MAGPDLIFQTPRPQFFDSLGVILNGGTLQSYQAGTTTPLATYSDSALTTPNANPLVLGSDGRVTGPVYLLPQSYKFVLQTSGGSTVWTADNVPGGYDAAVIVSGTIALAQLGTGTPTIAKFLRGDGAWSPIQNTVTTTSTGSQNDFAPGLVSGAINIVRCNNGSDLTLTGLSATSIADGTIAIFETVGAGNVFFAYQSASSGAANRFTNAVTSGNTPISSGGVAIYKYGTTSATWRLVSHLQGAYITRAFSAANYTASTGTWTVASATRDAYYLAGRMLTLSEVASGTTSGTPTQVKVTLPNGYSAAGTEGNVMAIVNNGGGTASAGFWSVGGVTTLALSLTTGNFSAGTVSINVVATIEVQ